MGWTVEQAPRFFDVSKICWTTWEAFTTICFVSICFGSFPGHRRYWRVLHQTWFESCIITFSHDFGAGMVSRHSAVCLWSVRILWTARVPKSCQRGFSGDGFFTLLRTAYKKSIGMASMDSNVTSVSETRFPWRLNARWIDGQMNNLFFTVWTDTNRIAVTASLRPSQKSTFEI